MQLVRQHHHIKHACTLEPQPAREIRAMRTHLHADGFVVSKRHHSYRAHVCRLEPQLKNTNCLQAHTQMSKPSLCTSLAYLQQQPHFAHICKQLPQSTRAKRRLSVNKKLHFSENQQSHRAPSRKVRPQSAKATKTYQFDWNTSSACPCIAETAPRK